MVIQHLNATQRIVLMVGVVAAVLIYLAVKHHHHHSSVDASALAFQIGASSCENSGYRIKPVGGSWETIYNCDMPTKTICVADQNNIPSNVTAAARFAFANALGGSKPSCLS